MCIVVRLHHSPAQNPLLFLNIVVKGGDFFFLTFICLCQVLVEAREAFVASRGSFVAARGLSSCGVCAQLFLGMWDLGSQTRDRT